jgi:hypothetical protein
MRQAADLGLHDVCRRSSNSLVTECLVAGRATSWPVPPLSDGKADQRKASVIAAANIG